MLHPIPGTHFTGPVGVRHIDGRAQRGSSLATILVVDDERPVRNVAELLLQRYGYRTLQAGSGAEAISICDAEGVDLVLSDVSMPGMDGFTLARELQRHHAGIPVVFMSGHIPDEFSPLQAKWAILRKPLLASGHIPHQFSPLRAKWAILLKPFLADSLAQAVAGSLRHFKDAVRSCTPAGAAGLSTAISSEGITLGL
jgi:CheY-like chemotaxis protein